MKNWRNKRKDVYGQNGSVKDGYKPFLEKNNLRLESE
jgi:hypothetical protein